jgi:hypothetical protein
VADVSEQEIRYTDFIEYPHARLRVVIDTETGTPTRFLVQLEYRVEGEWNPVVHFDHNPAGEFGHDITEEGLHMDIYRDGEQYRVKTGFPPVALSDAPAYAESHIREQADQLLRRYEQWHNLTTPN